MARTAEPSRAFREAMDAKPRVTPAAAFNRAREILRAGERIDMVALAAELGVARGTLYRWTGDRDQLIGDVVWAELQAIAEHLFKTATGSGRERLERGIGAYLDIVSAAPALRALLRNETGAVWLLTAPSGRVRPRLVTLLAELIARESATGAYRPPAPPELLADAVVSLGERFLHNAGDPSLNPDPATAKTAVSLLLREASETA